MSQPFDVRVPHAPPRSGGARGVIRWICTSNPFYVLSAALFLAGLWVSFGGQAQVVDAVALMAGLAGYTLLLAATAFVLVRFGNVWDDVRTVLLLVVLMFLATSVTFDEALVLTPRVGFACYLGGLAFAVAVSEGLLRGIRLRLPALFRVPYYLFLALFFLYPLALQPLLGPPRNDALLWGLFGFPTAAGLVLLTLLPAVRRGPTYVRANGSPWRWPLYPWVLFGVFGIAVPGRAYLLCYSLDLLGMSQRGRMILGPYFLVPFALAVAVVLLESGIVSRRRGVLAAALAAPVGLVLLAVIGHRPDPIYQGFLQKFTGVLHGDPLFLTLLVSAGFYGYAALRGVPRAVDALTGVVAALAVVGPNVLQVGGLTPPRPEPLVAAALLQLGVGLWGRSPGRCLVGAAGLVVVGVLVLPGPAPVWPFRELIAFHLTLLAALAVGALFDNAFCRALRVVGSVLVFLGCLAAIVFEFGLGGRVAPWMLQAYPLGMAALLLGYAVLLGTRPALPMAALILAAWLAAVGWRGYHSLRQVVVGLDYLILSLTLFVVALLISVAKSGVLSRRFTPRRGGMPPSAE